MSDGNTVPGTEGYAHVTDAEIAAIDTLTFEDVHRPVLQFFPGTSGKILDVGAGSGRDAAALAQRGHHVTAVEPVAQLREAAQRLHAADPIVWVNDSLPGLATLIDQELKFDVILVHAVWTHLDKPERHRCMSVLANFLNSGGVLILALRHGPMGRGRRQFDVTADETIELAEHAGLQTVLHLPNQPSVLPKPDVTWTRLVFQRG